jgi:DNA-binding CsgD family transcriptional regulator
MFLRLSREIPGETPGRGLTLGFLFAAFATYILYGAGIVILALSGTGDAALTTLAAAVKGLFVGLDTVVIAASVPRLLARARLITDGARRAAVRAFSLAAAAAWAGRLILFVLSGQGAMFFSLYILVFFAGNILPLAAWRNYLINNVPSSWASVPLAWDMKKFSGEFNISKREEEVIRQVLEGKTNKEIAAALFITLQTVKDHLYRIFQKTDVRNRVQLINLVQSYGAEDPKGPDRD